MTILKKNKKLIEKMAELLLEKEYISKDEFIEMMADPKKIDKLTAEYKKTHAKKVKKQEKTDAKIKKDQAALLKTKAPTKKEERSNNLKKYNKHWKNSWEIRKRNN
jgi:hypothetical protein